MLHIHCIHPSSSKAQGRNNLKCLLAHAVLKGIEEAKTKGFKGDQLQVDSMPAPSLEACKARTDPTAWDFECMHAEGVPEADRLCGHC